MVLQLKKIHVDLSGSQEKEGHFHYKNFLELRNEVSHAIPAR